MNIVVLWLILNSLNTAFGLGEVIFALNAGGDSFTDSFGIRYRKDHLTDGIASDYGKMIDIKRTWASDRTLYDTERYHSDTFGYTIPMPSGDGDYVLWLKFCEVWFSGPGLKVFDVALNDAIVIENLDIFKEVGRGVAHDEVIPFQVRKSKIIINDKSSNFNNEIRVEFLKGPRDNPKVNAIIVLKGLPDQVPPLPEIAKQKPLAFDNDEEMEDYEESEDQKAEIEEEFDDEGSQIFQRKRREFLNQHQNSNQDQSEEASRKPKKRNSFDEIIVDPYASDDTYLIPILVAIGAFVPLLLCVCKL